jgi:hypothetical protein
MSQKIQNQPENQQAVQGEGDYRAARRYRAKVTEFLDHADVDQLARKAAPTSALEACDLALAAERGENRSRGDDPADVAAMYPGQVTADSGK